MLATLEHERLTQRRRDAFRDSRRRALARDVVEQHRELVAAEPRDDVAGAQRLFEPRRDHLEQIVAGLVAEAVVYELEAVEVEKDDRRPVATTLLARQRRGQVIGEQRPVRRSEEHTSELQS